jgi:ankyrin repeat protein
MSMISSSIKKFQMDMIMADDDNRRRSLRLKSKATKDRFMNGLNARDWSPLVDAIFRFGVHTNKKGNTAKSEEELDHLIRVCKQRGLSMNSGAQFGSQFHRPLIVAAYYGYHSAVRLLLEFGALPDLPDSEGRNVLFAALQNPTGRQYLRDCDKRTAQVLVDSGVITSDLGVWRRAPTGSMCYVNDNSISRSAKRSALNDRNVDVVTFLCSVGGVITDKNYLLIRRRGRPIVKARLLAMAAEVYAESTHDESRTKSQLIDSVKSWNPEIDWSFPPTWKVAVALCGDCGLPSAIFRAHVVPFLDRDWFFSL